MAAYDNIRPCLIYDLDSYIFLTCSVICQSHAVDIYGYQYQDLHLVGPALHLLFEIITDIINRSNVTTLIIISKCGVIISHGKSLGHGLHVCDI